MKDNNINGIISGNSPLITPDFLLQSKAARNLYHGYAASLPIIDYHNHLPPDEIAENKKFSNFTPSPLYIK